MGDSGCVNAVLTNRSGNFAWGDDGTVTDTRTQLIWQRNLPDIYPQCSKRYDPKAGAVGDACFPEEATSYCEHLTLANAVWRLPDPTELGSLIDTGRTPTIDSTAFPNTPPHWFCSSLSAFNVGVMGSNFGDGMGGLLTFEDKDASLSQSNNTIHHIPGCRVRCVMNNTSANPPAAGSGGASATEPRSCAKSNGGCSSAATCKEGTNQVTCECGPGYMGDGVGNFGCQDIDECATSNGGCLGDSLCINMLGAPPKCTCAPGVTVSDKNGCIPRTGTSGKYTFDERTVTDSSTKLTWQRILPTTYAPACTTNAFFVKGAAGSACRFSEASFYCMKLDLAGAGWHLPTREELMTLVDASFTPNIDPIAFPNTPMDGFWSSTVSTNGSQAWFAYFNGGVSSWTFVDGYGGLFARCVRGAM